MEQQQDWTPADVFFNQSKQADLPTDPLAAVAVKTDSFKSEMSGGSPVSTSSGTHASPNYLDRPSTTGSLEGAARVPV